MNDPAVRATRSGSLPTSPDDVRRRLGGTLGRNDDTLALMVYADREPVGHVYLIREKPNDQTYRWAELAYWVARGKQATVTPRTPPEPSSTTDSTDSASKRSSRRRSTPTRPPREC
jgi:hypothetical protein